MRWGGYTNTVHSAVMLALFEVSMSTELNISSSRSVCVLGASAYRVYIVHIRAYTLPWGLRYLHHSYCF